MAKRKKTEKTKKKRKLTEAQRQQLRSEAYWDKRGRDLVKKIDKKDKDLEQELIKTYEDTARLCLEKISVFYARYGTNNVIEYKQLLKKLPPSELKLLIRDIDKFVEKYPQWEHLQPVRENIYKLDRYEGLKLSIELEQLKLAEAEKELITQHLEQVYSFSYNHSLKTLGYGTNFNAINSSILEATLGRRWAGNVTYLQRVEANREKIANWLEKDLTLGLARGETYENLSRTFKNKFEDVSIKSARRLVRTEGTYIMAEANAQAIEEEFGSYIYKATLDNRTTEICRTLNGQKFKFKDRKPGINFPPMHPNCRSRFIIDIKEV